MSVCIIELNDAEIRIAKDSNIVLRSPGVAVVGSENIYLGNEALERAYLTPRKTYNRYWQKLNQGTLQNPTERYRHHADLAYAHLLSLYKQAGKPEEVVFAVPGSFSDEQLSMLLGIAEACLISVVGLVDSAVASTASIADSELFQHLDIHLHQLVVSKLHIVEEVSRQSVEVIEEVGLNNIYTSIAGVLADLFIKQSRFDPLHHAETEQVLYNQLPDCLHILNDSKEVLLEIQFQQTTHQAKLGRDLLLEALQPIYQKMLNGVSRTSPCHITDRLATLPGFTALLPRVNVLSEEAVFEGCEKYNEAIRSVGPALNFVTSLPSSVLELVATVDNSEELKVETGGSATHVLVDHQAFSLGVEPLYLLPWGTCSTSCQGDEICSVTLKNNISNLQVENGKTVQINGMDVKFSFVIKPGDKLNYSDSGAQYLFIKVLNSNGP